MTAPVPHLGLTPTTSRFSQLMAGCNQLMGRSQMSRRLGQTKRAYFQILAASRLFKMAINTK